MKITNMQWVIDPITSQRNCYVNAEMFLSLEFFHDMAGEEPLISRSEVAQTLGEDLLREILANKPPIK